MAMAGLLLTYSRRPCCRSEGFFLRLGRHPPLTHSLTPLACGLVHDPQSAVLHLFDGRLEDALSAVVHSSPHVPASPDGPGLSSLSSLGRDPPVTASSVRAEWRDRLVSKRCAGEEKGGRLQDWEGEQSSGVWLLDAVDELMWSGQAAPGGSCWGCGGCSWLVPGVSRKHPCCRSMPAGPLWCLRFSDWQLRRPFLLKQSGPRPPLAPSVCRSLLLLFETPAPSIAGPAGPRLLTTRCASDRFTWWPCHQVPRCARHDDMLYTIAPIRLVPGVWHLSRHPIMHRSLSTGKSHSISTLFLDLL